MLYRGNLDYFLDSVWHMCSVGIGMLSHAPTSGIESGMAGMPDFYKEDELKYHGKVNRGVRQVNLLQVGKFSDK